MCKVQSSVLTHRTEMHGGHARGLLCYIALYWQDNSSMPHHFDIREILAYSSTMKDQETVEADEEIYSHGLTKREYRKYYLLGILIGFLIIMIGALAYA